MPEERKRSEFNRKEDRAPIDFDGEYLVMDYTAIVMEYLKTHKERSTDGQPDR